MLSQQYTRAVPSITAGPRRRLGIVPDLSRVFELDETHMAETLEFLTERPVHTVVMTSFIHDNGFDRELNRGRFYAYRNASGKFEGVALIGHSTLFEARSDDATAAFAYIAKTSETPIHLIMSSGNAADRFWETYTLGIAEPRMRCEEVLFETAFPFAVQKCELQIENADMSQLLQVAEAQAEVAFTECGVDPMLRDREGFLKRVARRIEQGRVFTVFENGRLVFKADIMAETPEVIYLEGVYVGEEYRGKGVGSKCLAALSLDLLNRTNRICLLSNVEFVHAHKSFQKAGYRAADTCVTLFV